MGTIAERGRQRVLIVAVGVTLAAALTALRPEGAALAGEQGPATPQPTAVTGADWNQPVNLTSRIGETVGGRDLIVHQFGSGEHVRMVIAGIHGGYEWNTSALARELISFLEVHPQLVPMDLTLYVLPSMNPDGEARSHGYEGRANDGGVDLNRNFPFEWKETWAPAGCWDSLPISAGSSPLSEPESRAVARFLLSRHVEALISYHSASLGIFAGGRPSDPGSIGLAKAIAAVTDYDYPPRETGCEYTGEMVDWAAANGISAIDIELSTHYSIDLTQNLRALLAFLTWQP
jgi:hypothetical protein